MTREPSPPAIPTRSKRPGTTVTSPAAAGDPRHRLGAYGESVAARHLRAVGMVLVDRNWRCASGEVDLVLRDGDVLVFCEVKTRTSHAFGSPLESIGPPKLRNMRRVAACWVREHGVRVTDVRLDMVGVVVPSGGPVTLEHVPGVG